MASGFKKFSNKAKKMQQIVYHPLIPIKKFPVFNMANQ